jgi:Ca2+-binding RTX toxin-like protein
MPTPKTYSISLPSTLTGNALVDSLISGTYWLGANWSPTGPTNLSYSFMAPVTSYFVTDYSPDNEYNALYELTAGQKTAITGALGAWSAVANLNFTLTTDTLFNVGDMRFGGYRLMDDKTAAWAYFPANTPVAGDVWIGPQTNMPNPDKGSYDYMTFVHEIGHALGLKHPFDASATNKTLLDPTLDDVHFTVMSYNSNYSYQPTTPMVLDIIAIQSLYGANMAWQAGDTVYKWAANQSIFETIWDGGGNDTIDGSNQLAPVSINLNEGAYSQIGKAFIDYNNQTAINDGLAIAYGAKIENAIGSAFNDILIGNALNNTLDGGAGADTMSGGDGVDTYYVDNIGDVVIETDASLTALDRVFSTIDYTLGTNVENLILIGNAINGTGNERDNRITGNALDNTLDGGLGADTMIGGDGVDTYYVDNVGDIVIETDASLTALDRVFASIDYTLGANVENLILTGNANLTGTGNSVSNRITGNDGDNVLDGGVGTDTLIGGLGNDTYIVDNIGDTVIETSTLITEIDTVRASVDWTLGANLENLVLTGNAINGTGNALNNTLTGNAAANTLDGGAGADTMIGGDGVDTYYVDNVGDVVIETDASLTALDRVFASIDYTLGANVENLILTGTANLNGTGNSVSNRITGNNGDNVLDGGLGADTLIGGLGNDTYIVDNIGDTVTETSTLANEIDTVRASVDWTLGANLENLVLTGNAINGTGNALNNTLTGNDGDNVLDGGVGADTLIGGLGNDTYIVDNIGDTVIETSTLITEIDTVRASVDWTLSANLENLVLTGNAINGTGNALDNTLTGNAAANTLNGGAGADTMIGGDGVDTYYVDNVGDEVIETDASLTALDRVFASIDYTLGANVENLILTGTANLNGTGNSVSNRITGNDGDNILDGGLGADTLIGGLGNDTYIVDNIGDTVTETSTLANEIDTVRASVDWTLGANLENLVLTGNAINGTGNALNNTLTGNAAANTLNGGAGADTMIGGDGVDTYYVDNVGDVVIETDASLTALDRVFASIDYTLGANVENLILIGNAVNGTGNERDNRITGNALANTLDGGAGADTMIGGDGVDTYIVDNVGDIVIETDASLTALDRVFASIDYTLGANVENLILTGTANLSGTGNSVSNRITGNDGDNILDGGAGIDTLIGGLGNDTYVVDNAGDIITETSTLITEIDTVRASVDWTLGANLENLVLTGNAINGTGNALNNTLTGNAAANTLNGGAGADTMIGGDGVDTYYVDNVGDVVIETDASLTALDRVFASIDYSLGANVENLILIGNAVNGTGNERDNRITGNALANTLDGGAGADTMIGGDGVDTYIVDNVGDIVIETDASLTALDRVFASIDYTLGANVENLILTGTANLNGTGNSVSNRITGNDGDNILDGGLGADTLIGGLGNDTYIVDNIGDTVTETSTLANEIDTVRASVDWTLGANLENLVLTGNAINGTGNALNNTLTGNAAANTLDGGAGADTMIGGDGVDTYYVDNVGDVVIETDASLTALDRVFASIDYTLGANVENLILTGTANLNGTGNEVSNRITGNAGDNILDGGAGIDTLIGGLGNDTYVVDNAGDIITETSTLISEIDTVRASVDWTLGANLENLVLTGNAINGTGNSLNNVLTGNSLNNTLSGGAGNDTLDGGLGADTMIGGDGVDTYYVDNVGDVVIETDASLTALDRVFSSINYTLGTNVENLILIGSADLNGTGNAVNNRITGNIGNNILDGGMGADTMIGGAGNDTYVVDNVNDVVIEQAGEGHDLVRTSFSYTLGANIEDLTLTGNANGTLIGNALDNVITGNSGINYIDGGLGADTMIGGNGDDAYNVDNINDVIVELAGEGMDTVHTSIDYTLADNVEAGEMIGNANLNLTGNALDNVLHGNDGNNILSGGLGADSMIGEGGDDIFIVDNVNDLVFEFQNGGHDLIRTSVDYGLAANVEDGTLLGSADLTLGGNSLDNVLTGNSGNNVLTGYGGTDKLYGAEGNDTLYGGWGNTTLTGGTGADTFAFTNMINFGIEYGTGSSHNVIADFNALEGDKIDFSHFDSDPMTLGLQHMTFIGSNEFNGFGQLRFVDHVLSGNLSPDSGGYFEVQLVGVNSLSANDVIV